MWSLVILIPSLIGSVASFLGASGASRVVAPAFALDTYQRRRGYKGGDGWASTKTGEGHGSIIAIGYKNENDLLGQKLSQMAMYDTSLFAPFLNKRYEFTMSEGKFLSSMLEPLDVFTKQIAKLGQMMGHQENAHLNELIVIQIINLRKFLVPISKYLQEFPHRRVKEIILAL
jgi:hypothetical protein